MTDPISNNSEHPFLKYQWSGHTTSNEKKNGGWTAVHDQFFHEFGVNKKVSENFFFFLLLLFRQNADAPFAIIMLPKSCDKILTRSMQIFLNSPNKLGTVDFVKPKNNK